MQFRISKLLGDGRFKVQISLTSVTEAEKEKFAKFGAPKLKIKIANGADKEIPVTRLEIMEQFAFFTQQDADAYVADLKEQINIVRQKYEGLKDDWSSTEVL
jgi:hypothetical protein